MFFVRGALLADLDGLLAVARHLDSVNLPNDRERLAATIVRSMASFAGELPAAARELLFVLIERGADGSERVVGSSMVFAQHGSRRAPHVFFDVLEEERYSETLDRHFRHKVLRIGYNYQGLTEIGGLVLLPELRGHPGKLGRLLVHVRFLFMALHRPVFREEVVSELMPPLEADGTSLLWEALGRNFTGLSYQEADRLSRENKEFIRALFPQDPIYAALLPRRVQELIGLVGPNTKGVESLLVRAGFKYAHRIDPFDGGPHFHARFDEIVPLRESRALVAEVGAEEPDGATPGLVLRQLSVAPWLFCARLPVRIEAGRARLGGAAAGALGFETGESVGVLLGT